MSDETTTHTFEFPARDAFNLLHTHARNGYEPGDCHCEACDIIVTELCDVLGITRETHPIPGATYWSAPEALRIEAARRGWYESANA